MAFNQGCNKNKIMNIALVIPSLARQGGGERQILYLARGLIKNGHEVTIYTVNYDKERCYPELSRGLSIKALYYFPARDKAPLAFLNTYIYYSNLYTDLRRIAGLMDRNTEIINVHGDGVSWLVLRLKPQWRGNFIWMCNDSPTWIEVFKKRQGCGLLRRFKNFLDSAIIYRFISYYDRRAIQKVDQIVTLSRKMKQALELYYGRRVNLLRSGIDLERFNKYNGSFIRERYGITPQDFLLVHVSLLQPLRKIEDAILSVAMLRNDYSNLKMLIVGSLTYQPSYVESLKRLIKEKGLDSYIILTGEVDDEELPLYYGACDGFIFPSDRRQSWGLVVFEAMASKRPVIVSSACGASEVLKDEREALFITPGDISGIATKIKRIIEDEGFRERIAQGGWNFVRENLSWSKYVRGMEEIFSRSGEFTCR